MTAGQLEVFCKHAAATQRKVDLHQKNACL
jgi:hypothetical protein